LISETRSVINNRRKKVTTETDRHHSQQNKYKSSSKLPKKKLDPLTVQTISRNQQLDKKNKEDVLMNLSNNEFLNRDNILKTIMPGSQSDLYENLDPSNPALDRMNQTIDISNQPPNKLSKQFNQHETPSFNNRN
jgi:hypothetical protein